MRHFVLVLMLAAAGAHAAEDGSTQVSNASAASVNGSATVLNGSIDMLAGAGTIVVESVTATAKGSVIVLRGAGQASAATIEFAGKISVAAGMVVWVATYASGQAIMVGSEIIAFVPNEIGKGLLHHSRA